MLRIAQFSLCQIRVTDYLCHSVVTVYSKYYLLVKGCQEVAYFLSLKSHDAARMLVLENLTKPL